MSANAAPTAIAPVILLRLGVGREEHALPEGATLADLLRAAHADAGDYDILINGRPCAECLALGPGAIVTLGPKPKPVDDRPAWEKTAGMFKDDPFFDDMVAAGRADREAQREEYRRETGYQEP